MLIFVLGIFVFLCFWAALKELGKAIGYFVGLVLALAIIVIVAGLIWQFVVWVFPYILGAAAVIAAIFFIVWLVDRWRRKIDGKNIPEDGLLPQQRRKIQTLATKLFVGNLSFNTTEGDVLDLFKQAGNVQSCELIMDKFTNKSRGFAFVTMGTQEEATAAVSQFNGKELDGRAITVNESHQPLINIVPRCEPMPKRQINWQSLTLKEKRREWDRIDRRRECYRKYLQSERWARKQRKVLKRDGHKCVHCGERASQVHHTQYAEKIGTEPIDWLETICSECHRRRHGKDKDEWDAEMEILIDEKIKRKRDGGSEYD